MNQDRLFAFPARPEIMEIGAEIGAFSGGRKSVEIAAGSREIARGPVARGIAAVFGERTSSTNPRYQQIRALLKEELGRLDPPTGSQFPPLTEEQQAAREALGRTPRT